MDDQIVTDGRNISLGSDAPGQKSFYIPPGNKERESYRVSTFLKFSRSNVQNPYQLAENGFYYTGYKDRVKCFSCGQCVQDWIASDNPADRRWHQNDCDFANGVDETNVPLNALFRQLRPIPASSPTDHGRLPTQSVEIQPGAQELTREDGNQPASARVPHSSRDSGNLFPCLEPRNPAMRDVKSREQTFIKNHHNWPSHRIRATPKQMAEAGLFYLGERDRVKCWYCNGGLQNWHRNDDPWSEHAKWFPTCEFLLQHKGPQFVHNIVAKFPNLNRPEPRT